MKEETISRLLEEYFELRDKLEQEKTRADWLHAELKRELEEKNVQKSQMRQIHTSFKEKLS